MAKIVTNGDQAARRRQRVSSSGISALGTTSGAISDIARLSVKIAGGSLWDVVSTSSRGMAAEETKSVREVQLKLLQDLTEAGIDPRLFDLMLSSELDRTLKKQFGIAFFCATLFFTTVSFAIISLNGIYKWEISELAITALIIETPLQFIGLLYIIARNLFPQSAPALRDESAQHDRPRTGTARGIDAEPGGEAAAS